jgi:hypothetical protein
VDEITTEKAKLGEYLEVLFRLESAFHEVNKTILTIIR